MKKRLSFLVLVSLILVSCSGKGPTNKELTDAIFGTFLNEVRIQKKTQCPITEWLEDNGQTNVWLVNYQYKESQKEYSALFSELPDGNWFYFMNNMDECPDR